MILTSLRRAVWLALGLFAVTVLSLVMLRPLLPIDETRYLTVAWEMWQGGSKIVPRLNGELYSHKPPMLFWLMNVIWSVIGVNELVARLVAPAFGLASVALTAVLARRLWPDAPDRAGLAALILGSGVVFVLYGSATMFDTMLTAATLGAMLSLVALRRAPAIVPMLAFGAAMALGVYAKGPVILVHVMPVALLYPFWADRMTRPGLWAWYRSIGLGIVVALVLVGLWLGPALLLGGEEYRTDVLWRQSAGRMVDAFDHDRPVWFFAALLPIFAWPWGWSRAALRSLSPRHLIADESARFVVIWAASALVAFSLISGKQVHYLLPELPALALLLSGMAVRPASLWRKIVLVVPALVIAGVAAALFVGLIPAAEVNGAQMSFLMLALTILVVVGLIIVVARVSQPLVAIALAAPATLLALHLALNSVLWAGYDPQPIAQTMVQDQALGLATVDSGYAGQFTFAGRIEGAITVIDTPEALAAWIAAHPGGLILSRQDLTDPGLTLAYRRDFSGKDYRLYRVEKG